MMQAKQTLADLHEEQKRLMEQTQQEIEAEKQAWQEEKQKYIEAAKKEGYQAGFSLGKSESLTAYKEYLDQANQIIDSAKQDYLNKIQGVSEAEVMVNLESTSIKVYEKNLIKGQQTTEETDTNGGTRETEDGTEETQTVLVRQGEREVPLRRRKDRRDGCLS